MAITAAQYQSMRLAFRIMLSVEGVGPTDGDVLAFSKQLFNDSAGATPLSTARNFLATEVLRTVLSAAIAPTDSNVSDFLTQINSDSSAVVAMGQTTRYRSMRNALRSSMSGGSLNPTDADVLSYFAPFAGYLGAVATRASMATNVNGAGSVMSRTGHIARDNITSLQAAWAQWYGANPAGYTAAAGTLTVTASVEYPAGTFTQIKWSGSASVVIASGLTGPLSDATAIPGGIPNGATFWIRAFLTASAAIVYSDGVNKSAAIGDLAQFAGSTDMTLGGTITDNNAQVFFPIAIVGQTAKRACLLLGHSLVDGLQDQSADATGDNGDLQRPLNPQFASVRLGNSGETLANFLTHAAQKVALAQYCTDIVVDYSANDLIAGTTAATMIANYTALAALFPGKKLWLCTASPCGVTTTDAYATLVNQTVAANNPQTQLLNTAIRATVSGFNGFIELADFVEQARSGKWKVDGTASKYTADGTHQTPFANQQITITLP